MNANPTGQAGSDGGGGGLSAGALRAILAGAVVLCLGLIAFFIWRGVEADANAEKWDTYFQLRQESEPRQDPLWNDIYGVFGAQRDRYIKVLESFLDKEAADAGGTLEAEVRWRIAKTVADHILAQRELTDVDKRKELYEKALVQMEKIQNDFPDFPLNWDMFKPAKFPSLTRKFVDWLKSNKEWEAQYLIREREPDSAETVVFRTNAGDIRVKLYAQDAKAWVEGFLARARNGAYDKTTIFEKRQVGEATSPREAAIRGGAEISRGLPNHDAKAHAKLAEKPAGGGLLPAKSRNMIPHKRGLMVAWHDGATNYDHERQFMFLAKDSPEYDYKYTPVGKLLDDASLATLDEIYNRKTWRLDPTVQADAAGGRSVLDFLQAPVVIEKVLVFGADGSLLGAAGTASEHKVAATDDEKSLASLKPDAYRVDEPAPPKKEEPSDDPEKTDGDGTKPKDD